MKFSAKAETDITYLHTFFTRIAYYDNIVIFMSTIKWEWDGDKNKTLCNVMKYDTAQGFSTSSFRIMVY